MSPTAVRRIRTLAVTGGTGWSEHAYGRAIDVNPFVNPYVKGSTVLPPEAAPYTDRTRNHAGMIHAGDAVVDERTALVAVFETEEPHWVVAFNDVVVARVPGHGNARLRIRIGDENEIEPLRSTSVVSTGYGPGSTAVGGLGVLGPTRMDYPGTIAAVRAVARHVGDLLAHG